MNENEIILNITYKCNWFCEYCSVDTHNQSEPDFERLLNTAKSLENINVTLTGGEPGTVSKEKLLKIIFILLENKCVISVNTNGLFLEKYPELDKFIKKYIYHCSENLDNIVIKYDKNVEYMIVVNDNNYKNLKSFMYNNQGIKFDLAGAMGCNKNLSVKNAFNIYKEYKNSDQVNKENLIYLLKTDNNKIKFYD